MATKIKNLLANILRWGLISLAFVLPFVVTPSTIYPFVFGKTLFFQSVTEILLALFIILLLLAPEYRPRWDLFTGLVLSYFGIMILTSFLGVDFYRSLWGTEERGLGLFTQLHFVVFFVMLRSLFREECDRERLLFFTIISGILLSAIALLRLKGILIFDVDLGLRLSSTLANPIFFASVLLIYFVFAVYLAAKKKGIMARGFYGLSAIGFFLMLISTQTRGAVLALGVGAIFFIISSSLNSSSKIARSILAALLVLLAIFISVFWLNRESQFVQHIPILNRFSNLTDTTASTRVLAWKVALKAWKEHPLLGWGPENFHIAFNKYYNPRLLEFSYYETWWDRPHNMVLEVLLHTGLIGLIVYLSIFVYAIAWLIKRRTIFDRILATGFLIYFTQNLFVFDTPSSLSLFMIMLSGIGLKPEVRSLQLKEKLPTFNSQLSTLRLPTRIVFPIILLTLGLSGLVVWKYNWQPFVASSAMLSATLHAADTSDVESIDKFRKALLLPTPYKEETIIQVAQITNGILSKKSVSSEKFPELFSFAEQEIRVNIERHPNHVYYHFMLGRLYTEALNYKSGYENEAEAAFARAIELSPQRQQVHFGLAKLYVNLDRKDEAIKIYKRALEFAPKVGEAHWFYAVLLQEKGEIEAAKKEMIEAALLGYTPPRLEERLFFARLMATVKNYPKVADYLESALRIEPQNADLWAQLAVAYREYARAEYEIGETSKGDTYVEWSRDDAKRAAELDPTFSVESKIFIEMLDKEFKK